MRPRFLTSAAASAQSQSPTAASCAPAPFRRLRVARLERVPLSFDAFNAFPWAAGGWEPATKSAPCGRSVWPLRVADRPPARPAPNGARHP